MQKKHIATCVPLFMAVHDESTIEQVMPVSGVDYEYNSSNQTSDWKNNPTETNTYRRTSYGDEVKSDDTIEQSSHDLVIA